MEEYFKVCIRYHLFESIATRNSVGRLLCTFKVKDSLSRFHQARSNTLYQFSASLYELTTILSILSICSSLFVVSMEILYFTIVLRNQFGKTNNRRRNDSYLQTRCNKKDCLAPKIHTKIVSSEICEALKRVLQKSSAHALLPEALSRMTLYLVTISTRALFIAEGHKQL